MAFIKMDRRTAKYLTEHFLDMAEDPFNFKICKECGSQYLEEVGHYCGDSITVETHDIKEGDVVEPIKIIPPSFEMERNNSIDNIFEFLKEK